MTTEPNWTEQQRDRFMVVEIALDELASVADKFPNLLSEDEERALRILQRDAFDGFAGESMASRHDRMMRVREQLSTAFPVENRTEPLS